MQEQQTIFAALSLGPVSISDQLSSYPTNASATITSNVPLVMSTCAATGDLLQPSYVRCNIKTRLMTHPLSSCFFLVNSRILMGMRRPPFRCLRKREEGGGVIAPHQCPLGVR